MNRVLPVLGDDLRPLKALVGHLKAREDSEHEQAILRIVLVGLITLYMWVSHAASATPLGIADRELLLGLVGFFVLAIVIFTSICLWPAANPPRRIVGMLADAGGTTFALFLTGSEGVGLIGVYLFITFGNGFRFGRSYLFICQALCLLGFGSVVVFAPWWNKVPAIGWGLVVSLVVLPLYVSTLLKRIQEARARAEEANRAKSSFLANMSHEMRTPLNGIVGITDLLQTTELSPTQTEFMRLLRHSVSLLRSLVDDVLDISKIEAGRIAIEIADFDLHAVLNGLVRLFRPHASGKGITLRAMVDPAIDYRLRGDSHHLRQVMVNLVSNAIKFTERGHVTIAVELSGETQEGYRLRFEVRDTGIGISDDARKRIFDQFVQADDSTTRRYGGTGLGTTIAKQLVELMGGAIGVTSVLGEGSTFWFELPLLRSAQVRDTTFIGEQDVAGVVVANDDMLARFKPLISATCGRIEIADSLQEALARVRSIQQEGVSPAVFVSGDVESAQEIFRTVAAENGELSPALIYLTATPPTGFVAQQLRELDGVTWIGPDASPRIVRNAIHLATTTESHTGAEVIDLGLVLKQQRQPLHILVAEDNVTNQTIIRQLLESAGHTVTVAGDGEEALDHYEQRKPDIAILDFNMPERSGLEVLAAIRNMEPVGTRLPTIILSASVTPDTRERAKQVGADEFVGKPFDAAVLLQVVDRLARRATKGAIGQAKPGSASVSRAGVPIVDRARLRDVEKIASGDMEFLAKLFDGFCVDVETMLKRLDSALANARMAEVPDVTHAIKGAALGIGAQQLAARCIDIDQAAAQGDAGRLRGLAAELRRCFDATSAQLTSYRQERLRASL